jgi:antitoxin component YwqK of YwqJK toxin-antitoxin module
MTIKVLTLLIASLFIISCNPNEIRKSYFENGAPESERSYKNGMLNGTSLWYYPNGNLQQEATYRDNMLHGPSLRWHENGKLQSEMYFKNNLKDSINRTFNTSGDLVILEHYRNDTLHGLYERYYPEGRQRMIQGAYVDGLMDGSWLFFSSEGSVIGKADYILGTGIQKAWHPNGNPSRVIHYEKNLRHGREEHYDFDGKLSRTLIFERGVQIEEILH